MLKVTNWVMAVAPFAVFAAMAATITKNGPEIIIKFIAFVGSFYLGLAILWMVLLLAGAAVIGGRIRQLIAVIRDPIMLAFSTASSEAAYPRTLEALEKFGVPPRISGFVLPLGYSFNLDGSMMYMTFATLFIAQLYGMHIPVADQIVMVLVLMLSSKGMAGVPRASLVVISGVMAQFHIPAEGLALILGVDQFLDMGRSGTNVVGNAVATAVVAKWEGALDRDDIKVGYGSA
jgi:Na+/H+-dicarboxylate symporter